MSATPITFRGTMYPRDKTLAPYAFTAVGMAEITGLQVGGGPILPPDEIPPEFPPFQIWGGPIDPYPGHPLPEPPPSLPPLEPPAQPVAPHAGWNYSHAKNGWYYLYVPGPTDPAPHAPTPGRRP